MLNVPRIKRLIDEAVLKCRLDLRGLTVLTEAASGFYALTPIIAAIAGAERVFVYARSTRFGSAVDMCAGVLAVADRFGVREKIEVLESKSDPRVVQADVITNLAMLRPMDATFLAQFKSTAAIPLMWETWEFRPTDLDLAECRRLEIPVLGTDEHQPILDIFDYVGHLSLKLLFEAGLEVLRSRVVVLGSGEFADRVCDSLIGAMAHVTRIDATAADWSQKLMQIEDNPDALCIVEHHNHDLLIGDDGSVSASMLAQKFPGITIAHISGGVDRASLVEAGLVCVPGFFAQAGSMSVATDYVGPKPLIDLHTAGLRVGEVMTRCKLRGMNRIEAEAWTLANEPLAQAF